MAGKIHLDLVTPERLLISEEVDEVIASGSEGEFGVLPGHCDFLTTLRIGELRYRKGDEWRSLSVSWGYAEVGPKRITVLAELAERAEEIDLARAEAAIQKAEEQLAQPHVPSDELERIRQRLAKAHLRKRVAEKHRDGGSSISH